MLIPKSKKFEAEICSGDPNITNIYKPDLLELFSEIDPGDVDNIRPETRKFIEKYNLAKNYNVKIGKLVKIGFYDSNGVGCWNKIEDNNFGTGLVVECRNVSYFFEYVGTSPEMFDVKTLIKLGFAMKNLNKKIDIARMFSFPKLKRLQNKREQIIDLFIKGVETEQDIKNVLTEKEYNAICKQTEKFILEQNINVEQDIVEAVPGPMFETTQENYDKMMRNRTALSEEEKLKDERIFEKVKKIIKDETKNDIDHQDDLIL